MPVTHETFARGRLGPIAVVMGIVLGVVGFAEEITSRGRITGRVLDAETHQPIAGAYVGTGDFGDSGGSNYARHREQGLFASTHTDEQGRFVLEGLAFVEDNAYLHGHPLVVTHPDYVRHDRDIVLTRDNPEVRVEVHLRKAARLKVTVVDAEGRARKGFWAFRLERLDGRRFLPPGRDPHLSSFASAVWLEQPRPAPQMRREAFAFTTLDSGDYRVDVLALEPAQDATQPMPAGWRPRVVYHGGIERVTLQAGHAEAVTIGPASFGTRLIVEVPGPPADLKVPNRQYLMPMVLLCRDVGALIWDMDRLYGPEDARLGRLQKRALFYTLAGEASPVTFENLPPGRYAVFAGPVVAMNGQKAHLVAGTETTVSIPPVETAQIGRVGTYRFDSPVSIAAGEHGVGDLCEEITRLTDSNPVIVCEASIRDQTVRLAAPPRSIWDLFEALYAARGWRLSEADEKTLRLGPAASP